MICPRCGRKLVVCDTKRIGDLRLQYIGCRKQRGGCGYRPANNARLVDGRTQFTKSSDGRKRLLLKTESPVAMPSSSHNGANAMFVPAHAERRAFDLQTVCVRYDLSPTTLARMIDAGAFPRPAIVMGQTRRWLASQLDAWEQAAARVQCGEPLGE